MAPAAPGALLRPNDGFAWRRIAVTATFVLALGPMCAAPAAARTHAGEEGAATLVELASMPLEDLLKLEVSSASRFPQQPHAAPSAVRVLHAAEIRAHGWRTLAEALASLPGLYVSYDRSYTYLGARGFQRPGDYNSRFLLLVDGYRLNDPVYGQAAIGGDFPIDIELIERIEYAPGPGSAVYGSNAYFGVVNVVTRWPDTDRMLEARVDAGSDGLFGAVGTAGGRSSAGTEALVSASHRSSDGADLYFPEFDTGDSDGVARGIDGERVRRLLLQARQRGVTVSLVHVDRHKETPTAAFDQVFGAAGSFVDDKRTMVTVGIERDLSPTLGLAGNVVYGNTEYTGDYLYEGAPLLVNRDGSEASWLASDWRLISSGIDGHRLVVGMDLQRDFERDQYNRDLDPPAWYLDDHRTGWRAGVFVEDEITLSSRWLLNAGLRYDHDSYSGGDISPRVALIRHSPTTTWKAIYGRAFRSPNTYEMFYEEQGSYSQLGNADLSPERIRTLELIVAHTLSPRWTVDGLVYHYRLNDLISAAEDGEGDALVFRNRGRATADGAEIALTGTMPYGAVLRTSYAHARVDAEGDDELTNSPRHLFKFNFTIPLMDERLLLALEGQHVGSRDGNLAPVPSYSLVNASMSLPRIAPGLELRATVRNLFGRRYYDPVGPEFRQNAVEQDGRSFLITVGTRF